MKPFLPIPDRSSPQERLRPGHFSLLEGSIGDVNIYIFPDLIIDTFSSFPISSALSELK